MTDWYMKHSKHIQVVEEIEADLAELSKAFYATGNTAMSENLWNAAQDLKDAAKGARDAVGQHINHEFKESQKQVGETLLAVIDGANKQMADMTKH
jgi:hypothetical protein